MEWSFDPSLPFHSTKVRTVGWNPPKSQFREVTVHCLPLGLHIINAIIEILPNGAKTSSEYACQIIALFIHWDEAMKIQKSLRWSDEFSMKKKRLFSSWNWLKIEISFKNFQKIEKFYFLLKKIQKIKIFLTKNKK